MNHVTVEGRTLKHALAAIVEVIERRATIPILSCVRITHGEAGLRLEATDLDIWISIVVDRIDGEGEWQTCLEASVLEGIAKVAGVMPLRIEPGDFARISLGAEDAVYSLNTLPAADFPEPTVEAGDLVETFTNGMLAGQLGKVMWCISTEETRYYLNGVCWQISEKGRRFVATDGHRLSACTYSREAGNQPSRIIPRKTVAMVYRHFARQDVRVYAAKSPAKDGTLGLVFEGGGLTIRSKLIDGTYPDVDRVIPKDHRSEFTFKWSEIVAALQRTTAISPRERGRGVRFNCVDGRVSIERSSPDFGTAKVRTSSVWPAAGGNDQAPEPFGFNGRYFLEVVGNCEGDIALRMTDPSSPFVVADIDPTMTRVIMPMRV